MSFSQSDTTAAETVAYCNSLREAARLKTDRPYIVARLARFVGKNGDKVLKVNLGGKFEYWAASNVVLIKKED